MIFTSTRDKSITTNFEGAAFNGLAPDGGLYVPDRISPLTDAASMIFGDRYTLGLDIMQSFITDISEDDLLSIIKTALSFRIPLVHLEDNTYLLEVFHGPTLAFKDVGARFMANIIEYYLKTNNRHISILVATSGDTGSAIANAFHNKTNIDIYVLYPAGKITFIQEQQITTLGGNVHAVEVEGTFDDCQKLVKSALMDQVLSNKVNLTTANSINLARLLPQIIYHAWGLQQLRLKSDCSPVLAVPSGNFGNLVSAIYAKLLGFNIRHFIAGTNANDIVPHYLQTGQFTPKPSIKTFSNAMDVGNPSNFERLLYSYDVNRDKMCADITGISVSDDETLDEIRRVYEKTGYILDPHTAVGLYASRQAAIDADIPVIVTATAHPAKFPDVIKKAIDIEPDVPERLCKAVSGIKQSIVIGSEYDDLKKIL